jgi:hypothetical protein
LSDDEDNDHAIGVDGDEPIDDMVLGTLNVHGTRLDNLVDRVFVLEEWSAPVAAEHAIDVLHQVNDFALRHNLPNKFPGVQRHTDGHPFDPDLIRGEDGCYMLMKANNYGVYSDRWFP